MSRRLTTILTSAILTGAVLVGVNHLRNSPEPTQTYSQQETQSTSEKPDLQRYSVLGTKKKSHDEKYPLRPDGTRPIEYYFPSNEEMHPFILTFSWDELYRNGDKYKFKERGYLNSEKIHIGIKVYELKKPSGKEVAKRNIQKLIEKYKGGIIAYICEGKKIQ